MNSQTKIIIGGVAVALLVFYGGFAYGKNHAGAVMGVGGRGFGNTAFAGQGTGGKVRTGTMQFGGFIAGKIMSVNDSSMTVSLPSGGSKIIFFSSSTPVMKTVTSSISDLAVGMMVQITGTASSDGSVTARSVEIRPETGGSMIKLNAQ
jgi:hypothetical protein